MIIIKEEFKIKAVSCLELVFNEEEQKTEIYKALVDKISFEYDAISKEEKKFIYQERRENDKAKYIFTAELVNMTFIDLKELGKVFRFERYIQKNDEEYISNILTVHSIPSNDPHFKYQIKGEIKENEEEVSSFTYFCDENLQSPKVYFDEKEKILSNMQCH